MTKRNMGILFLLGISLSLQIPGKPEVRHTFRFDIYEFHADHIIQTEYGECTPDYDHAIPVKTCSLYSAEDIYDVQCSDNIERYESSVSKNPWRGVDYELGWFRLYLLESSESQVKYSFSYKINRLPHLHDVSPIDVTKSLHFGLNSPPNKTIKYNYKIVAIPITAYIEEVFGYLPEEIIEWGRWKLFVYNNNKSETNVGIHVRFTMYAEEFEDLDFRQICDQIISEQEKKEREF